MSQLHLRADNARLCLVLLLYAITLVGCSRGAVDEPAPLPTQTTNNAEVIPNDSTTNLPLNKVIEVGEIQNISVGFETQDMVANATSLWILGSQQIAALNLETLTVERSFQYGNLSSVAFTKVEDALWIVNDPVSKNGFVTEVNANNGHIIRTLDVGRLPRAIEFDGENLWVANFSDGTVTKIRASDGELVGTFPVGQGPLALTFDSTNLWVANSNDNTVTVLNPETGDILHTYLVGKYPSNLLYVSNAIWVSHLGDNTVMKLDPDHSEPVAQFDLSSCSYELGECGLSSLAFDGYGIWITIPLEHALIRFDPTNGLSTHHLPFPEESQPAIVRHVQSENSDSLFIGYASRRGYPEYSISRVAIRNQSE